MIELASIQYTLASLLQASFGVRGTKPGEFTWLLACLQEITASPTIRERGWSGTIATSSDPVNESGKRGRKVGAPFPPCSLFSSVPSTHSWKQAAGERSSGGKSGVGLL
jgi:hypothetical protein